MRRPTHSSMATLALTTIAVALTACAVNVGGGKEIPFVAMGLHVDPGTSAGNVAASLSAAEADVAIVTGAIPDSAWLAEVGAPRGLTVSGPAGDGDVAMGFLAGEPLGDTTLALRYTGGHITLHDALYAPEEDRYLDLMVFRLDDPATVRPAIGALLRYMATDVDNNAAVLIGVVVPTAAVGDSVARMLSPAYFDALRCEPGLAPPSERVGIRLFYGPEARVYCQDAGTESPGIGDVIRARLVMGRR